MEELNKNNEEKRRSLLAVGIPTSVIATTLPKEGRQDIRDLIQSRSLVKTSGSVGLFFYPTDRKAFGKARKLFLLTGKEIFLSGVTIYAGSINKLVELLRSEEYTAECARLDNAKVILITDFYEDEAEFPLTGSEATQLRNWIKAAFESNKAVCFLSDTPIEEIGKKWWPTSFMSIIREHVVEQPIA